MIPLELQTHPDRGSVSFAVRVQPRASKNEVAGVMDGVLKIRLQAPAVENRANEALCAFLAELLKRPKSAVRLCPVNAAAANAWKSLALARWKSKLSHYSTFNSHAAKGVCHVNELST
jgi:uncharacterized protein